MLFGFHPGQQSLPGRYFARLAETLRAAGITTVGIAERPQLTGIEPDTGWVVDRSQPGAKVHPIRQLPAESHQRDPKSTDNVWHGADAAAETMQNTGMSVVRLTTTGDRLETHLVQAAQIMEALPDAPLLRSPPPLAALVDGTTLQPPDSDVADSVSNLYVSSVGRQLEREGLRVSTVDFIGGLYPDDTSLTRAAARSGVQNETFTVDLSTGNARRYTVHLSQSGNLGSAIDAGRLG